jgi:hypothetical protein
MARVTATKKELTFPLAEAPARNREESLYTTSLRSVYAIAGQHWRNVDYMAAGLLFGDARTHPSNATYDNWAIWYTFEQGAVTSSSGWGSLSAGTRPLSETI